MITLNVKSKRAKKMERLIKQLITITLPFNYIFGKVILLEKSECLMNCLENFKSGWFWKISGDASWTLPLRLCEVRAILNVIPLGRPRIDIINEYAGDEFSPATASFTTILPPKFNPLLCNLRTLSRTTLIPRKGALPDSNLSDGLSRCHREEIYLWNRIAKCFLKLVNRCLGIE